MFWHGSDDEAGRPGSLRDEDVELELDQGTFVLRTPVRPSRANHTFNGIMFDVHNNGIEDVVVTHVVVGGEIGDYSIYHRPDGIQAGYKEASDWTVCAAGFAEPNWHGTELPLQTPVVIQAGKIEALYIHSTADHDRSIAYQRYA